MAGNRVLITRIWNRVMTFRLQITNDYTIGTLDMLQACDACADMGGEGGQLINIENHRLYVDVYGAG